jgi:lysophospholipase L1-like esterase
LQGYAVDIDPNINLRHFAASGRALFQDIHLIADQVERYNPEYLLVLLSFNDIAWHPFLSPADVLGDMKTLVARARAVKPNIKFAIGNVPKRQGNYPDLPERTDAYNKLLAEAIPKWSTEGSPVELVHMRETYSCEVDVCPAGYDGLHPNTLGDYQIAHAFSRVLVEKFGLGEWELPVPDPWDLPVRQVSVPKNIKTVVGAHEVNVTWDRIYGARRYDIHSRKLGDEEWSLTNQAQHLFRSTFAGSEIVEMEYQVRVSNGNSEDEKGEWSKVIGTCRPWSTLTNEEKWSFRWWFRRIWVC